MTTPRRSWLVIARRVGLKYLRMVPETILAVPGAARLVETGIRLDLQRTERGAVIAGIAAAIAGIGVAAVLGLCGAQAVSRFDGVYELRSTALVPGSVAGYGKRPCSFELHARPLRIVGGHATTMFRRDSDAAGDVGPQGELTLTNSGAFLEFTGKIDAQGVLRGYLNTFDGCGYDLIWWKRP